MVLSHSKKAIIITLGDVCIDYDRPFIDIFTKYFNTIFANHIGQELSGIDIVSPSEKVIRELHCKQKTLRDLIEGSLYITHIQNKNKDYADPLDALATALNIDENMINAVALSDDHIADALEYIDLEIFDGDENFALRGDKRDILIDEALKDHQRQYEEDIQSFISNQSLFIDGTSDILKNIKNDHCILKVILIADEMRGFLDHINHQLLTAVGVPEDSIKVMGLRELEGKDVKDIFHDLEYINEKDIMVCTNHVGLLSRSTGLDFLALDKLSAEFYDINRVGGAGFSRKKDAPYNICMIGYNKSRPNDMTPSTIKNNSALCAEQPSDLETNIGLFLNGSIAHSFSPTSTTKTKTEKTKVLKFPQA